MVMGSGVLGPVMDAFHQGWGAWKGALTLSFSLSSVSEPLPSADDAEGKVPTVLSAHEPTAVIGHVWDLFQCALFPEFGLAMGAAGMLVVRFERVGAVGSGGCSGRLIRPVYVAASGKPLWQLFNM